MQPHAQSWDYLIVTASNEVQAAAYRSRLALRRELSLLSRVRRVLVLSDPDGRRIGSGASTALCLMEVLRCELPAGRLARAQAWQQVLGRLRVLIVHAGGDSRRLPAYGPCGKIFVPVPGRSDSAVAATLFDRQLPLLLDLPPAAEGSGQVVLASGDVLLLFDPRTVRLDAPGVVGLGSLDTPEQAAGHGVYCGDGDGGVRRFLQKPSPDEQARRGAIDPFGRTVLDVGVFQLDADSACRLLEACGARTAGRKLTWSGPVGRAILRHGLDFYRECCCAMGRETSLEDYLDSCRSSGSGLGRRELKRLYEAFHPLRFSLRVLERCSFLHFGTTRQLIVSGESLVAADRGIAQGERPLDVSNQAGGQGSLAGSHAWVEGCRLSAPLSLEGWNLAVGVDVDQPLRLPAGACLDVLEGRDRRGRRAWFVRCYAIDDNFKAAADAATFCGRPLADWLAAVGLKASRAWPARRGPRDLWTARLFPAARGPEGYRDWLWMWQVEQASEEQKRAYRQADRYSLAEMADLADPRAFALRRRTIRGQEVRAGLRRMFRLDSEFSADDLACLLRETQERTEWVAALLREARWYVRSAPARASEETPCGVTTNARAPEEAHGRPSVGITGDLGFITFSRILHTLASAMEKAGGSEAVLSAAVPHLVRAMDPGEREWLEGLGLGVRGSLRVGRWVRRAREVAMEQFSRAMVASAPPADRCPRSVLRSDEIVWGRAPARLDFGGGWTDTPPCSLERGGCVLNAAVDLNGQPPIQAYARVIAEPVIRIASIDLGRRIEIRRVEDLLDYRDPESSFGLAKAALAFSGLGPDAAPWPRGADLRTMLGRFGGGIELTTLAAIPKGSGLGTSSIMGAVILAVIQRVMGRTLTPAELFNGVLRLEQAMSTGGGWQDQVGGAVGGVKLITTEPGLAPDPRVHFVPDDVLDPRANGGCSLLYYTGITRLAKNILQKVVGRYLDRERGAMEALRGLAAIAPAVADAMAHKDLGAYGRLVSATWELNKQLDPDSTNDQVEALMRRVGPYVHGAKLLGAGGGGFLLMICKSGHDAGRVRHMLETHPPNERARFFDFDISRQGLVVTVC